MTFFLVTMSKFSLKCSKSPPPPASDNVKILNPCSTLSLPRSACYLGFVAEQFGLDAEFPFPGDNPDWSTDCQAGASRRSSAVRSVKSPDNRPGPAS